MKKIFLPLLIVSFLWSCTDSTSISRSSFLGTWDNIPHGHFNHIEFYQDSAVFWSLCSYVLAEWKVQNDTLHFKQLKGINYENGRLWFLPYRLNSGKDSLTLIMPKGNNFETTLFKVKDKWKHFLNGKDLAVELPVAMAEESLAQTPYRYPVLYLGWKNEKLSVKANGEKKEILTNLELTDAVNKSYYQDPKDSLFTITMVADKHISKQTLDSIKNQVKSSFTHPIRFFRVYQPEHIETNYGHINLNCLGETYEWNWYGQWEQ